MGNDVTHSPSWGAPDSFAVQSTDAGRITWRTEGGRCRVEDRDLLDIVCGWAERKGGDSGERRVLFVKEKMSDKIIKIHLTDVFPKCLQ